MSSGRRRPDDVWAAFLGKRRWFQHKGCTLTAIDLADVVASGDRWRFGVYKLSFKEISPERYLILTDSEGKDFRSLDDTGFLKFFFEKLSAGGKIKTRHGTISFEKFGVWDFASGDVLFDTLPGVTSNTLVVRRIDGRPVNIVKFMRRLQRGKNVEAEINRHLFESGKFQDSPTYRACATYKDENGDEYHIASLFDFVRNEGSTWEWTVVWLKEFMMEGVEGGSELSREFVGPNVDKYVKLAYKMGETLSRLHIVLSGDGTGSFGLQEITGQDIVTWCSRWLAQLARTFDFVRRTKVQSDELRMVLSKEKEIKLFFDGAKKSFAKLHYKIRQHGDFHLGQMLVSGSKFFIIDFEGEPLKPYSERAIHYPALKDVAGIMRSFNYAAFSAYFELKERYGGSEVLSRVKGACRYWESMAKDSFLKGYYAGLRASGAKFLPLEDAQTVDRVLKVLMLDKALYEIEYEVNNRPSWLPIPLGGVLEILGVK